MKMAVFENLRVKIVKINHVILEKRPDCKISKCGEK
jgi:hypothetical protein